MRLIPVSLCISRQVCLFLKRGATQNDEDEDGQDPLSIAVQQANADIVTLYVDVQTHSPSTFQKGLYIFLSFPSLSLSLFSVLFLLGCVWPG